MVPRVYKKYGIVRKLQSQHGPYLIYLLVDSPGRMWRGIPDAAQYEIVRPVKYKDEWKLPGTSFWGIYGWSLNGEFDLVEMMNSLLQKDRRMINYSIVEGSLDEEGD